MQQSAIDKQLIEEHEKFLNSAYNKSVPENLLEIFEKALMVVPPQAHGINFSKIKSIINKEISELSISDINDIVKVVFNTPLQVLYDSLYDAIPEQIKMEKFVIKFNLHLKEFMDNLQQKRTRLASLSDGVLKTNGMRIIPNGNSY